MGNYYERLGVSPSATSAEIKAAFVSKKKDAQRLMVSKNAEEAKKGIALVESLTEAYKTLSSEEKRRTYDQMQNISAVKEKTAEAVVEETVVEEPAVEEPNADVIEEVTEVAEQIEEVAEEVSAEVPVEETVIEKTIVAERKTECIEKTRTATMPTKPTVKPVATQASDKGRAYETRQVNESKEASNKNGLLIGGGAVLIVIVIILLGYIGYQAFSEKEDTVTQSSDDTRTSAIVLKNESDIPDGVVEYNGHYYYVFPNVCDSWEEAKRYCEQLGGHLAVINDEVENKRLYHLMKEFGYNNAYFGLSDVETNGNWKWVTGERVTYTNWNYGEPNNERNKEHYAMFYYKSPEYKWNDGDFGHGTFNDYPAFICEWDDLDLGDTKKEDFAVYCGQKDSFDADIARLAGEINTYIAKNGDLKGATDLHQKCKDLRFNVEKTLRDYQRFAKQTQMQRDLENLMELELVRVTALERGVEIGLRGGNYTDGFRDGSIASQKFKKLNKIFNEARGSY